MTYFCMKKNGKIHVVKFLNCCLIKNCPYWVRGKGGEKRRERRRRYNLIHEKKSYKNLRGKQLEE